MSRYLFSVGIIVASFAAWQGFQGGESAKQLSKTVPESQTDSATVSSANGLGEVLDTIELDDGGVIEKFPVPDFTLPTINETTITLSEYKGKKPVVVVFFATWCPNCRRDMPKLEMIYQKYRDQVEVIGVDLQESEGIVKKFADVNGITYPIALDRDGAVGSEYGIQYTNSHILIDRDGFVADFVLGDLSEEKFISFLESEK